MVIDQLLFSFNIFQICFFLSTFYFFYNVSHIFIHLAQWLSEILPFVVPQALYRSI